MVGGEVNEKIVNVYNKVGKLIKRFDVTGDTKYKLAAHNFYVNRIEEAGDAVSPGESMPITLMQPGCFLSLSKLHSVLLQQH